MRTVLRAALAITLATAVSGCSLLFDKVTGEEFVPGERVSLRTATDTGRTTAGGTARVPQERTVNAWPQAGGSSTRSVGNIRGQLLLEEVWSRSIGSSANSSSKIISTPVANNSVIFALDAASTVTARTLEDGDFLWEAELTPEDEGDRDGFGGGLAISGSTLIAATGFGEVIGLDTDSGERIWTYRATAPIRAAPAVSDGVAVVVTRDGRVIALNARDGTEAWSEAGVEGGAAMLNPAAVAIAGDIVAAPFASGEVGVFRLSDGRRGWSETLGAPQRGSALSLIADVTSPPVISSGRVFAGGISGRVVAFDVRTGRRVWARDLGIYNPVWVAGDVVYLVTEDSRAMAINARTGSTVWEHQLPRFADPDFRRNPYAYGGPIMVGGALFLTSTGEFIHRIDAETGQYQGEVDLPGPSSVPPIAVGGRLYVVDDDGDLHAFE